MKVRLINLDRHTDRLAHMRHELGAMPFERIPAVDGGAGAPTTSGLTRFELACLASHRIAWRALLEGSDRRVCILEDDLHLERDFAALLRDKSWIPADAHAVKLDTYFQRVEIGAARGAIGGREAARLYSRHQSSAAYIVSREGAARYLELTEKPERPADYALFPNRPRWLGLRIYQLTPAVAVQDHLLSRREGGQTFATAMTEAEAAAKGGGSLGGKLEREAVRLVEQAADLAEWAYLKTLRRSRTVTVPLQ